MSDLTQQQVRAYLGERCELVGGQHVMAKRLGLSASYLCDVLAGRKAISRKLADKLGFERVITYRDKAAKCDECHGTGYADSHVTGRVECGQCQGSGYAQNWAYLSADSDSIIQGSGEPDFTAIAAHCEPHPSPQELRTLLNFYGKNDVAGLYRVAEKAVAQLEALASSAPEARAEVGQTAVGNLTANPDAVSQKADSDPAVDLLRATVNRLMGERDALAGALRGFLAEFGDKATNANVRAARSALAQLDSVAPPLTPND